MAATVQCRECGEQHKVKDVEFVDVEEDIQGYDVYKFVCPVTKKETTSHVRGYDGSN